MNILFYTPVNFRCRDVESLAEKFISLGHQVFMISQCEEGPFQKSISKLGVKTFPLQPYTSSSRWDIVRRVRNLITFCNENKIDVCFSHLEPTNFVSVLAQPFLKTKFSICRHHIDVAKLNGFDKSWSYRFTYNFAKRIVCVSRQARDYMIEVEKVSPSRIFHIDLGYNFGLYPSPDPRSVEAIREKYAKGILLLTVGSLNKNKRPELNLELVKRDPGVSIIFLGAGQELDNLKKLASEYGISDRVSFAGYADNVLDYMAAADFLVHPSISESSCVVVKEAGLVGLPVMVCKGVGDFDDYMHHRRNGIVLSPEKFADDALETLKDYSKDRGPYREMASRLKSDILAKFSIDKVIGKYVTLIDQ